MQAAVYLLGKSTCPAQSQHGTRRTLRLHVQPAALLEAVLDAAPQSASQAFYDARAASLQIRMCITCAKLGKPHELEV